MTLFTNRLVAALIGLTIAFGLAGCSQQPQEMTAEEFAKNRQSQQNAAARGAARR